MKPDTGVSSSSGRPVKLLDQVRAAIRVRHCSIRTEQAYVHWVARFIRFSGMRHPRDMGAREVTAFLSALATELDVAAATQQQALPTVLNSDEISSLLDSFRPEHALMARLLYGTGMRPLDRVAV